MSTDTPADQRHIDPDLPSLLSTDTIPLQSALHAATRTQHLNLNKTITARLPLCLPPHTSDPTAYYLGILMFGHIFMSFERAMQDVLGEDSETITNSPHTQSIHTLHTERLLRNHRLRNDYRTLSTRLQRQNPHIMSLGSKVQRLAEANTNTIYEKIRSKPYLGLAYSWTMYLALFNGGRWLHRQLASAGPDFWQEEPDSISESSSNQDESFQKGPPIIQPLSFWRFETSADDPDAESLKLEFKSKFEQASSLLNSAEHGEIVLEAVEIFQLCLKMVQDLDVIMKEVNEDTQNQQQMADEPSDQNEAALGGMVTKVWQSLSSNLLAPAYSMLNARSTRPIPITREEIDARE